MHRFQHRGKIRPKISTMPRQKSEAAAFLDIYKLVVEKKRLQQELQGLDQRRIEIVERIAILDRHVTHMEGSIQQMREAEQHPEQAQPQVERPFQGSQPGDTLNTIFLDY